MQYSDVGAPLTRMWPRPVSGIDSTVRIAALDEVRLAAPGMMVYKLSRVHYKLRIVGAYRYLKSGTEPCMAH